MRGGRLIFLFHEPMADAGEKQHKKQKSVDVKAGRAVKDTLPFIFLAISHLFAQSSAAAQP